MKYLRLFFTWTIIPFFYAVAVIPAAIMALMDHNNGRSFKQNFKEIMGFSETKSKK